MGAFFRFWNNNVLCAKNSYLIENVVLIFEQERSNR